MARAGTTTVLYLANSAAALQNLQPYFDNITVPQTVTTLETSVMGTTAKTFITGLTDGDTISLSGPYDPTIHTHLTGLKAAQAAGSAAAAFVYGPGGSVASQARSAGSVFVAQYQTNSTASGRVEWSASLQVTGTVTNGTF